jgi:nucleotide-binding universal stress UspA family protein
VLSVYQSTLPASLAVRGALPVVSINAVLRRQCEDELAQAVSGLDAVIDVTETPLDGDPQALLARESGQLDLLVVGSRGYGPLRAVLLGSLSSALVRGAQSPLVIVPRGADGG